MNRLKVLILFFLFFAFSIYSQEWKEIGKTNIFYSDFSSNRENVINGLKYEYFKRDFDVIIVEKNLGGTFRRLFKDSPEAFYEIFEKAYDIVVVDEKDEFSTIEFIKNYYLDFKLIPNLIFNRITILSERIIIKGDKEMIWWMRNGINVEPCYLNVIFKKNVKKKKLDYIKTIKDHCEI